MELKSNTGGRKECVSVWACVRVCVCVFLRMWLRDHCEPDGLDEMGVYCLAHFIDSPTDWPSDKNKGKKSADSQKELHKGVAMQRWPHPTHTHTAYTHTLTSH